MPTPILPHYLRHVIYTVEQALDIRFDKPKPPYDDIEEPTYDDTRDDNLSTLFDVPPYDDSSDPPWLCSS